MEKHSLKKILSFESLNNAVIFFRNIALHFLYIHFLKPFFFRQDPEKVHEKMIAFGRFLGKRKSTRDITSFLFSFSHPMLEQNILGIHFQNPIGLAAGFDKDGVLTDILPSVGFGFMEIGSVTGEPCEGNPKPRLWRLPNSKALAVYYGLKNEGCEKIAARLQEKNFRIPLGTSIAKTNCAATIEVEAGVNDYLKAFCAFLNIGDYFTINISCPNAFGGEPFSDPKCLDILLSEFDKIFTEKPIFLKISPDLEITRLDALLEVCEQHLVKGFICSNLTKKRDVKKLFDAYIPQNGGISGKVMNDASLKHIRHIYRATQGRYVVIGCGGVFSAEDAYEKIRAGASLIQMITGMIFEGPQNIGEINRGLVALLKRDGFASIQKAIGTEH